jgi:hypothetical protein
VHALVAPPIWWAEIAFTIDRLTTTSIERLILASIASRPTNPLDRRAIVIMRHATRAVVVLDLGIIGVAPGAVETWWRGKRREEGREDRERVGWRVGYVREHVRV